MILFVVRVLAFEFGGKIVKALGYVAGALLVMILLGSPVLGIFTNPLAPFWLSGKTSVPVAGGASSTPVPVTGPVPTPIPVIGGPPASVVDRVIAEAMTWRGTRYLWGGCDRRGVDCSCFVLNAWATVGVHLPRTTTEQVRAVAFVPREQIQAGDLVFFNNTCTECGPNPTHVGLALSSSQMIEAGDPVQVAPINSGFYGSHYASAGRVTH